jgi:hypothetical protein
MKRRTTEEGWQQALDIADALKASGIGAKDNVPLQVQIDAAMSEIDADAVQRGNDENLGRSHRLSIAVCP